MGQRVTRLMGTPKPVVTTIRGCSRCGGAHADMIFNRLTVPQTDDAGTHWTHWALCPTLAEPILLRVLQTPNPTEVPNAANS